MIPKIYDTQRIARIIGVDGSVDMVKINPDQPEPVKEIRDQEGLLIEKIYNPTVGVYDVMVTTGPGYMTKRQEALDAMSMLLQSNPELWSVAGDLFIKNMDWPGAQEMAARFAKIIDPKVLEGSDESPELQAAKQQLQAITQELHQAVDAIEQVQQSAEVQKVQVDQFEAQIKAYDAETKRIAAVQNSMTPEQIQDIVMGTLHAAMDAGDLVPPTMQQQPMEGFGGEQPVEQPEPMGEAPEAPMEMPNEMLEQAPEGMM